MNGPDDQKDFFIIVNEGGEMRGRMSFKKGEFTPEDILVNFANGEKESGEELFCFLADSEDEYESCTESMRDAVLNSRPIFDTEPEENLIPIVRPKDNKFSENKRDIKAKTIGGKVFVPDELNLGSFVKGYRRIKIKV